MKDSTMQNYRLIASALLLCVSAATAQTPAPAVSTGAAPATEQDKLLYALGVLISRNLQTFSLSAKELDLVGAGLKDGALGRDKLANIESYGPKLQQLEESRRGTVANAEKQRGAAYLTQAAAAPGAVKAPSGFVITSLKAGTGAKPTAASTVKVHYEGKLTNGRVFDSSIKRGQPASFPLSGVIRCWTEGLKMMKVGGKSRLVCPASLAYGDNGSPPNIPGGATLVFEVELLAIEK